MLHAIESKGWEANTAYCVPTAISLLTGTPLIHSHSRAAFIQDRKLKEVKGVYAAEALLMLREQGYVGKQINLQYRYEDAPTMKRFLKDRTAYEKCLPLMIQIEDSKKFCHMVVSHYDYAADNHTMKPVSINKFPHLRKRVTGAWVISKL